jgi:hypothetical protein
METIMETTIMSQRRTVQDLIGGILIMTSMSSLGNNLMNC